MSYSYTHRHRSASAASHSRTPTSGSAGIWPWPGFTGPRWSLHSRSGFVQKGISSGLAGRWTAALKARKRKANKQRHESEVPGVIWGQGGSKQDIEFMLGDKKKVLDRRKYSVCGGEQVNDTQGKCLKHWRCQASVYCKKLLFCTACDRKWHHLNFERCHFEDSASLCTTGLLKCWQNTVNLRVRQSGRVTGTGAVTHAWARWCVPVKKK